MVEELAWQNLDKLTDNEIFTFKNTWNAVHNFRELFASDASEEDTKIGAAAVPAVVRAIKAHLKKRSNFPSSQKLQIKMCDHYFPAEGTHTVQGCLQFLDSVHEISKTVRVHTSLS
jgi:hypothetical protein